MIFAIKFGNIRNLEYPRHRCACLPLSPTALHRGVGKVIFSLSALLAAPAGGKAAGVAWRGEL